MVEEIRKQIVQEYSGLRFEEGVHLYFWKDTRVKKSVSGKVEEVVPPFDEQYWSKACENRNNYVGMSAHQIIHKWQTTNQMACELGTNTHNFLEHYKGNQNPSTPQEEAGVKFLKWLMTATFYKDGIKCRKYTIISKELRAYSKRFKFAGTMDLPVYDHELGGIVIFDYKTNGDLFKTFGYMLGPFSHMLNHPFNHYQLQLSYYSILLEEIGLRVIDRQIVYLMADAEYRCFSLEDYSEDIVKYLTRN